MKCVSPRRSQYARRGWRSTPFRMPWGRPLMPKYKIFWTWLWLNRVTLHTTARQWWSRRKMEFTVVAWTSGTWTRYIVTPFDVYNQCHSQKIALLKCQKIHTSRNLISAGFTIKLKWRLKTRRKLHLLHQMEFFSIPKCRLVWPIRLLRATGWCGSCWREWLMQTALWMIWLPIRRDGLRISGVTRETFERISKPGLIIKPSKWQFGFRNRNFVGHIVGYDVLRPGESKVQAVQEASRPQTKRQVNSFLGLVGFCRKYIPSFASVEVPLTDLRWQRKVCHIK